MFILPSSWTSFIMDIFIYFIFESEMKAKTIITLKKLNNFISTSHQFERNFSTSVSAIKSGPCHDLSEVHGFALVCFRQNVLANINNVSFLLLSSLCRCYFSPRCGCPRVLVFCMTPQKTKLLLLLIIKIHDIQIREPFPLSIYANLIIKSSFNEFCSTSWLSCIDFMSLK